MPTQAIGLTEQEIAGLAQGTTLFDGRGLIKKGAYQDVARSADGTLVFGACKGSGRTPYQVSVQLHPDGSAPSGRCTCPSRIHPCKHAIGMMLLYAGRGAELPVAEPPADLAEKAKKHAGKREVQAGEDAPATAEGAPAQEKKPRKANTAAQAKKAEEQKAALATLEQFLIDLVTTGLAGLSERQIAGIQDQAKRMADADLKGYPDSPRELLLRLGTLVGPSAAPAKKGKGKKGAPAAAPMPDEERHPRLADLVTRLWATVRKGQKVLENKLDAEDTASDADAYVESILGKKWDLDGLKAAGHWVKDRHLLELAHERYDHDAIGLILTSGFLLDLEDGAVHMERTLVPTAAEGKAKHRQSREGVLEVREAALYPGTVLNRRIRWEDDALSERPRAAADYARVHQLARPLAAALKAYRDQIKNPLNPYDGVVLLAALRFGIADGDLLVMEDAADERLVFKDPLDVQYPTTANMRHAAGAYGPGTALVRLWYDLRERAIYGQALALLVGETHLRLGL